MQPVNTARIQVEEISAEVVFKPVKNMRIRVKAPGGDVHISAPRGVGMTQVRDFLASRLEWVRRHQKKIRAAATRKPFFLQCGEMYQVWGRKYMLLMDERDRPAAVRLRQKSIILSVRPGTGPDKRLAVLEKWFREQVRDAARDLADKWAPVMQVRVNRIFVQSMKTKWGSCNTTDNNIRLNTDLVHHQPECLEYLVVHELAHLLEPSHNKRFQSIMDEFYPLWRKYRRMLNG